MEDPDEVPQQDRYENNDNACVEQAGTAQVCAISKAQK